MHKFKFRNKRILTGLSVLEVILAIGIFSIIGLAASNTVVFNFTTNRLGEERLQASLFLQEGMDAVRNIKKAGWTGLTNGTYGLSTSSGHWAFSGSSDTTDQFTRTVTVSDAYRDGSGNLASSGTLDPSVKRVRVRIAWNYTSTENKAIENYFYVTNYEKDIVDINIGSSGVLVYADYSGDDDVIKYKLLEGNETWSTESTVPDVGAPGNAGTRRIELYSSVTRHEKVMISKHATSSNQYIYAQVWNGSAWGNLVQLASYASASNPETRNFDGYYLDNGNFVAIYGDATSIPKSRAWNGSSWGSAQSLPDISSTPVWISAASKSETNTAMVGFRDSAVNTKSIYYNGSSWGSVYTQGGPATGSSYENLVTAWSIYGEVNIGATLFNEASDNTPNIRFWEAGSWGPDLENKNINDTPRAMQLVARPSGSEFLWCMKDSDRDIHCIKAGHHSSWQTPTNDQIATLTDDGNQRSFAFEYERTGNIGVVVYSEGSAETDRRTPKYRTYDPEAQAFSSQGTLTALGLGAPNALESVRIIQNPANDNLMVMMGDSSQIIYTQGWNGSSNSFNTTGDLGRVIQGTHGSDDVDYWFDFEWDTYDGN